MYTLEEPLEPDFQGQGTPVSQKYPIIKNIKMPSSITVLYMYLTFSLRAYFLLKYIALLVKSRKGYNTERNTWKQLKMETLLKMKR